MYNAPVTVSRDCEAVQIPNGDKVIIPKGTQVQISQSLGGTFTVITDHGYMVRISAKDADAIGQEVVPTPAGNVGAHCNVPLPAPLDTEGIAKRVWDHLKTVYDPEIPVNVVELGLIYACKVQPSEGGYQVEVTMSLTAPGCGMGDVLRQDAEQKIMAIPGVKQAKVEVVFDPPWHPGMMSEAARLQLGF